MKSIGDDNLGAGLFQISGRQMQKSTVSADKDI